VNSGSVLMEIWLKAIYGIVSGTTKRSSSGRELDS